MTKLITSLTKWWKIPKHSVPEPSQDSFFFKVNNKILYKVEIITKLLIMLSQLFMSQNSKTKTLTIDRNKWETQTESHGSPEF